MIKWARQVAASTQLMCSTVLFFTASLSLLLNPFVLTEVIGIRDFNRIFGPATLVGIDASLRIQLFQVHNFIFVPFCFILAALFCHFFVAKYGKCQSDADIDAARLFLNSLSVCALALVVIFVLKKYDVRVVDDYRHLAAVFLQNHVILLLPLIIAVATLVYIRNPFCEFKQYRLGIFVSLGLALYVNFLFQSSNSQRIMVSTLRFYVIFAIITTAVLFLLKVCKNINFSQLQFAFVLLSYGLLLAGLSLEGFNVLNQHGIFVTHRLAGAKILFSLLFFISVALFFMSNRKFFARALTFTHWETLSILGLLLSFCYFTEVPPLTVTAGTELFEQANHGMLVNDLLAWGKFPIINSFDSHNLRDSFGMLVYGIFNGDVLGASYYNYTFIWMLLTVVCSFVLYKNVFDKYFAFFFILIAPSASVLGMDAGVISIAALLYAQKKKSFGAYLWLLFTVLIAALYQFPTGYSYGGAAFIIVVASIVVDCVKERKFTHAAMGFTKAFAVFAVAMLVCYLGICIQQQIPPVKRALEFISIAMSTNHWTYPSLGDSSTLTFGMLYSVLPIAVIACLAWLIMHYKNKPIYHATCALFLCYMLNCTRALQRHSLAEGKINHVILTAAIGFALFIVILLKKNKRMGFVMGGLFIVAGLLNGESVYNAESMANVALANINSSSHYYNGAQEKSVRVDLSPPLEYYATTIDMINTVIPEGETYLDLSGQTMLYALTGREKPIYPNQSVTHVSGSYSQLRLIEEVEYEFDGVCDFALVNTAVWTMSIDDVSGFYRYYYAFEYLYANYRPLVKVDDYALWIRKSRYDDFAQTVDAPIRVATLSLDKASWQAPDVQDTSAASLIIKSGIDTPHARVYIPLDQPILLLPTESHTYQLRVTYKSSRNHVQGLYFDFEGSYEYNDVWANVSASNEYVDWLFVLPPYEGGVILRGVDIYFPTDTVCDILSADIITTKSAFVPIDLDYLGQKHSQDIKQLPYIWGNYDDKKAWNNAVVFAQDTPTGALDAQVQQNAKYALLQIDSPADGQAALTFLDAQAKERSAFMFATKAGNHRYLIRCSTDWWWNNAIITQYNVVLPEGATLSDIAFLVGD